MTIDDRKPLTKLEIEASIYDHRSFRDDYFWQQIPAWKDISEEQFADHTWQSKNSIKTSKDLVRALGERLDNEFLEDMIKGLEVTPMNVRMTPYVFSLIDWDNPIDDPLRKQFLPVASQFLPDHPFNAEDSLGEETDSPVPTLTHRYPDKVLFLPLTMCPVYCSYCTRSRVIGGSTNSFKKNTYGAKAGQWDEVFDYIRSNPEIEDVVISGGDSFNLRPEQITLIGETLLEIPHIRRFRYATKGIAVLPMKILSDEKWYEAINNVVKKGRSLGKQVFIHTHFSSPREITIWNKRAMDKLFQDGIIVRNQAVLQDGVNMSKEEMICLTRKLSYMNIQPYYVYQHDIVPGVEHFRTTIKEHIRLCKEVRGTTAGFNTPLFICDAPGGGGKRPINSYEYYDEKHGISVWTAPLVKPGELFFYFDPIHKLEASVRERWSDPVGREEMLRDVIKEVDALGTVYDKEKLESKVVALLESV